MEFSTDYDVIKKWIPLVMEGRDKNEIIAATKVNRGKDVDFGNLTNQLVEHLLKKRVRIKYNAEVKDLNKIGDKWVIDYIINNSIKQVQAKYIFNGAGGYAINILQKSGIKEANGYAGFPVSGQWLICDNPKVVKQHNAKVYGKASIGTPPMSVPHLDTRVINGKKCLLFGPYAGATTKFLKTGKETDFFKSIRFNNIISLIKAGITNIPLTKYLITEVVKDEDKKFESLKEFYPNANKKDWKLEKAGQRVQVINNGVIEFGTEVVVSEDKTFFTVLGASPGASTAVTIISEIIEKNMGLSLITLIPNFSNKFRENKILFEEVQSKISCLE
jgi:malate dehydrogenase (quinone)